MNKKYLFGMLLSGALLTACTADDALDTAKVAKQGEMSAPVFTVSMDNGDLQNRAHYTPGNGANQGNKVWFDLNDKLSLFHGIKEANLSTLEGYQNAIYLADEETDKGLTFHTYAMVQPGYAIMVYPADTGFDQTSGTNNTGAKAPVVKIDQVQEADMKDRTPYISEFLNLITDRTKDPKVQAGFGYTYDLVLRRAAGTLRVTLDKANEASVKVAEAGDIEVRAIEISYPGLGLFSLQIPVKADADITSSSALGKKYKGWAKTSELALNSSEIKQADSLKTKDIENNVATFTILPCKWGVSVEENDVKEKGHVNVYTNYGVAKIESKEKVFGSSKDKALDAILKTIATGLYHAGEAGETEFVGQGIGAARATTMKVDMNKLEMNGMHVANGDDLKTLLKVFNAGKCHADDEITLYLDGDDDGKFTMDAETWALAEEHMLEGDIHFVPCKGEYPSGSSAPTDPSACVEENTCTTIVLQSAGSSEVPNMVFEENNVVVNLEKGNWTYKSKTSSDKAKVISGVTELHVTKGVHLTPSDFVAVYGKDNLATTTLKLVIDQEAFMDVNSSVDLQVDVLNKGTITIAKGTALRAGQAVGNTADKNSKTLENWSQDQATDVNKQVTGLTRKCGTIVNNGTLGVVGKPEQKLGFVNNYGVININDPDATTTITNNALANYSFKKAYANDNKIGTINLNKIDDKKVDVTGEKGFIVAEVNVPTPAFKDFGGADCAANYVRFGDKVKDILYNSALKDGNRIDDNLPTKVMFIEITAPLTNFDGNTKKSLDGVYVNNKCEFDIVKGASIGVGGLYVPGTMNVIGSMDGTQSLVTYFGETESTHFTGPGQNIN